MESSTAEFLIAVDAFARTPTSSLSCLILDRHGHGVSAVQLLRPCPTALAGGGTRDGVAILQWDEHLLGRDWFVARRWPPLFVSIVAMQMMPAAIPRRMHRISSDLRS